METTKFIDLLCKFVDSRPGLNPYDYGCYKTYNRERAEITRDRSDFYELLNVLFRLMERSEINQHIESYLKRNSDRLTLTENGKLNYITGQYFPTEYRPAASRVLTSILWRYLQKDCETGHEIRAKAKKYLSRRVVKNYFN